MLGDPRLGRQGMEASAEHLAATPSGGVSRHRLGDGRPIRFMAQSVSGRGSRPSTRCSPGVWPRRRCRPLPWSRVRRRCARFPCSGQGAVPAAAFREGRLCGSRRSWGTFFFGPGLDKQACQPVSCEFWW